MTDIWNDLVDEFDGRPVFFQLHNDVGLPVPCRICGETHLWQYFEGHDGKHGYFACVHGVLSPAVPIRVQDSIPNHTDRAVREDTFYTTKIFSAEIVHRPDDPDYDEILGRVEANYERYEEE